MVLADGSRVSDTTTTLSEHPAGTTKLRVPRRRSRPARPKRWQARLWDSTPTSVLTDEAGRLADEGHFRKASRLLAVAATTIDDGPQRRDVLRRLAVASAEGGQHRISCDAVFELQTEQPHDADTWVTFANVALARGNYSHADRAARSALELDENHQGAWIALATGYCGLGWFEAAEQCLDHVDREQLSDRDRNRIGRAVNRWSLSGTRWILISAVAALLVGVLAIAVAASVPFVTRDWRLQRLRATSPASSTKFFESLATDAWKLERKLRAAHASAVVVSIIAFVAATTLL